VLTNFCSMFLVMGVIDASLKMWGQHDLKKLIAYGTVQEMNLLTLAFIWGDTHLLWGGILFSLMHASLSSLLFYTVDCVQRRFNTRSLLEVLGILLGYPNLGTTIFFNSVLYAGLPGTLKFLCEFYLFSTLLECSPLTIFLILINANWFGILGFSKCWFTSMFGMFVQRQKMITLDLTIKEFLLIVTCYLTLFTAVYLNTYYYIIW
jgi:NADH:ubiquinone oxidoreductase subunit 4 (subunit M)